MNMPSGDEMAEMLSNPAIAQSMNEALNNPQFIDMMIQSNPMLRNMPNAREMLQSPMFRAMMTDPEAIRAATRMRSMMGQGGAPAFPAPGATDSTPDGAPASNATTGENAQAGGQQPPNPFAVPPGLFNMFGMPGAPGAGGDAAAAGAAGANPFAQLFGTPPPGAAAGTGAAAQSNTAGSPTAGTPGQAGATPPAGPPGAGANPFGMWYPGAAMPQVTPEAMQQALQALGLGGGFGGGFGGAGGMGSPQPADNRPPEERYADQLRQLNEMGFYDFDRNVAALRRSGGSVQGAIQHLLGD